MSETAFIGLDNSAFTGRLRRTPTYVRRQPLLPGRRTRASIDGIKSGSMPDTTYQNQNKPTTARGIPKKLHKSAPTKAQDASAVHVHQNRSVVLRRDTFKPREVIPIAQTKMRKSRQRRPRVVSLGLVMMAILLFLTGMFVSVSSLRTNHKVIAQVSALSKQSGSSDLGSPSTEVPSEIEPPKKAPAPFTVAPDLPKYIRIPNVNIEARVLRMGVDKSNQLKAPGNIFDAGWYEASAKPGEPGAVLIDGHVSGPTKHGIFYNLRNVNPGDPISIENGDGRIVHYSVVKLEVYPVGDVDMGAALTPIVAGKNGLNIMTCTGKFDAKSNEYLQRLIVFASED